MIEGDVWRWAKISPELVAELYEWSEPVQVQARESTELGPDGRPIVELIARRVTT